MHFPIEWDGSTSLAAALSQPLCEVALHGGAHGDLSAITLLRHDGAGLRISSTMHDVVERVEIGTLVIETVASIRPATSRIPVPESLKGPLSLDVLTIEDEGATAESGIELISATGARLTIVSAAFPYCIHVHGLGEPIANSHPEYPLDSYRRTPLL